MSAVLASAADARYGYQLLNMVGSVKANSDLFDAIVAYDLGLTPTQRRLLRSISGVDVRPVPPFVPHWAACWSWKPWLWANTEADVLLYLDAGLTVLRALDEPLEQIRTRGYFVVGTGLQNAVQTPTDYFSLYGLPDDFGATEILGANIVGFRPGGPFFDQVVRATLGDVILGRNLGWSADEVAARNVGINHLDEVVIRAAPRFRHDQTLFNIHVYSSIRDPVVNDVTKYGGSRSPDEHPEQLVWAHRRRAGFPYLTQAPYGTASARATARVVGAALQAPHWLRVNGRDPRAYVARAMATWRRR